MFDKPNASCTIGLESDGSLVKGIQLSWTKGKPILTKIYIIEINSSQTAAEHVNPLDMIESGQALNLETAVQGDKVMQGFKSESFVMVGDHSQMVKAPTITSDYGLKDCVNLSPSTAVSRLKEASQQNLTVTTLKSNETLIRALDVKLKKESDIDSVLAFQAEPLLPYPAENAILDRITLSQGQEGTQLTLIAARKDHIQQHLEQWKTLGIDPEVISAVPVALAFFSKLVNSSTIPHIVIHLGNKHTTCALIKEGKLLSAQSTPIGRDSLTPFITSGELTDFANLNPEQNLNLYTIIDNWRRELSRLIYSLSKPIRDVEINDLFITGEGVKINGLSKELCKELNKNILIPEAPISLDLTSDQLQRFAVPLGAALSALPNANDQINFRQQEFVYPHPWKRLLKSIAAYFMLCIALAFSFYLFGNAYLSHQEDGIRQEYVNLLSSMNKTYPDFEKVFTTKYPSAKELDNSIKNVEKLSQEDIAQRLQFLNKEIKDNPDSFPLLPNTPRVSDVLAWISTHPNAVAGEKGKPENAISLLQIENFSYSLVKRPDLKKKQEKYQVKVEIEFSTSTPKLAREFHDALIAPNDIVDPKGEVKWSTNRGKYRASFFLKDKTVYPQ